MACVFGGHPGGDPGLRGDEHLEFPVPGAHRGLRGGAGGVLQRDLWLRLVCGWDCVCWTCCVHVFHSQGLLLAGTADGDHVRADGIPREHVRVGHHAEPRQLHGHYAHIPCCCLRVAPARPHLHDGDAVQWLLRRGLCGPRRDRDVGQQSLQRVGPVPSPSRPGRPGGLHRRLDLPQAGGLPPARRFVRLPLPFPPGQGRGVGRQPGRGESGRGEEL
mmetsp:Transcript_5179/g.12873  ORF Transcript_5179/g.12873 Transcript_5179/m.12873 type:complete len:217 (+) Transcript_5179:948-1598(+)